LKIKGFRTPFYFALQRFATLLQHLHIKKLRLKSQSDIVLIEESLNEKVQKNSRKKIRLFFWMKTFINMLFTILSDQ